MKTLTGIIFALVTSTSQARELCNYNLEARLIQTVACPSKGTGYSRIGEYVALYMGDKDGKTGAAKTVICEIGQNKLAAVFVDVNDRAENAIVFTTK